MAAVWGICSSLLEGSRGRNCIPPPRWGLAAQAFPVGPGEGGGLAQLGAGVAALYTECPEPP